MRRLILLLISFVIMLFAGAGAGLYFFREALFKEMIIGRISQVTGFETHVETLEYQWPATFTLQNVVMMNYPGYKEEIFAASPYFYIDIDLERLLKKEGFFIRNWLVIISKLNLEKSKQGVTNGALLKSIKNFLGKTPGVSAGKSSFGFAIDHLELKIEQINYLDRTGVLPERHAKNLKLHAGIYENVTSFAALVHQIESEVKDQTGTTERIVKFSPFFIERGLKKAAKGTTGFLTGGAELIADGAGRVVKSTTGIKPALENDPTDLLKPISQNAQKQIQGTKPSALSLEPKPLASESPAANR